MMIYLLIALKALVNNIKPDDSFSFLEDIVVDIPENDTMWNEIDKFLKTLN